MSYAQVRSDFMTILNRQDLTTAQADVFMGQAMQRITRTLRLPSLERALLVTPTDNPMVQMPVPVDLIQVIDVLAPDPISFAATGKMTPLKKLSYRQLMARNDTDMLGAYARFGTQIYFRGPIGIGSQLQFLYYGNASAITDDTQDNELTAGVPDLVIYAALKYAGDFFEHPLTAQWEQTYNNMLSEVMVMASDLENQGGVMVIDPVYGFED